VIEEVFHKDSFFVSQYQGDENQIQEHIKHLVSFDKGRSVSNNGGYQSNNITFGFYDLINFAIKSLDSIGEKVVLNSFWANVNRGNDYNASHVHNLIGWSAVYYHKVCCEKSTLNFHHLVPTVVEHADYNYVPKEKNMVFFKSHQPHSVSPCYGENHERISIAFNFAKL